MDLANKLCIVTGANSGIGKETGRAFEDDKTEQLWEISKKLTDLS